MIVLDVVNGSKLQKAVPAALIPYLFRCWVESIQ